MDYFSDARNGATYGFCLRGLVFSRFLWRCQLFYGIIRGPFMGFIYDSFVLIFMDAINHASVTSTNVLL